jgi:hypothetical protein
MFTLKKGDKVRVMRVSNYHSHRAISLKGFILEINRSNMWDDRLYYCKGYPDFCFNESELEFIGQTRFSFNEKK